METDLIMEHSVRNRKDLIKSLGANKNEKAIARACMAADVVAKVEKSFSDSVGVRPNSSRHSKSTSDVDRDKMKKTLKKLRPFRYQEGRNYSVMISQKDSPFLNINLQDIVQAIQRIIMRLRRGQIVAVADEEEEEQAVIVQD